MKLADLPWSSTYIAPVSGTTHVSETWEYVALSLGPPEVRLARAINHDAAATWGRYAMLSWNPDKDHGFDEISGGWDIRHDLTELEALCLAMFYLGGNDAA